MFPFDEIEPVEFNKGDKVYWHCGISTSYGIVLKTRKRNITVRSNFGQIIEIHRGKLKKGEL